MTIALRNAQDHTNYSGRHTSKTPKSPSPSLQATERDDASIYARLVLFLFSFHCNIRRRRFACPLRLCSLSPLFTLGQDEEKVSRASSTASCLEYALLYSFVGWA